MVKQCILAIDVGTSAVKVLAANINQDRSIELIGSSTVPATGFVKGNIVDAPALASVIFQAVECVRMTDDISINQAFLSLGGNALCSYNSIGSIAPASPSMIELEDIRRACRAAAVTTIPDDFQVLHAIPTAYWIDGNKELTEPTGKSASRLEVEAHIVAMPQAILGELTSLLAESKITIDGIRANAIVGTANIPSSLSDPYVYIDMGAGVTDIVVVHDGQIRLSASLPLGGDYITNDIMHGLNIGRAHAEEIKRCYGKLDKKALRGQDIVLDCNDYGTKEKKASFDFLYDVVESRVEEIVTMTHHYLKPALSGYNPQQILMTGGCSLMPSITEACERFFGLPIHIISPQTAREYAHPANAACYGLLKHAVSYPADKKENTGPRGGFWQKFINLFKSETMDK
jgi:cell division protein FtsA